MMFSFLKELKNLSCQPICRRLAVAIQLNRRQRREQSQKHEAKLVLCKLSAGSLLNTFGLEREYEGEGGRVCLGVWSRYVVTTRIKPGDS